MKRYNKQQVMKDAHRLYNNDFQRRGRSWSECLKAAWSWERDAVRTREEKAAKLDAMIVASWAAHNARKNEKPKKKELKVCLLIRFLMLWAMVVAMVSIVVIDCRILTDK